MFLITVVQIIAAFSTLEMRGFAGTAGAGITEIVVFPLREAQNCRLNCWKASLAPGCAGKEGEKVEAVGGAVQTELPKG